MNEQNTHLKSRSKIYTPKEGYILFIHMMLGVYRFLITTLGGYIVDRHLQLGKCKDLALAKLSSNPTLGGCIFHTRL